MIRADENKTNLIESYCKNISCSFLINVDLKKFSYFKTGGNVSIVITPNSYDKLVNICIFLKAYKFPFKVVGETSNLLFIDDVNLNCLVVTSSFNSIQIIDSKKILVADSGVSMPELSRFALLNSISGFEGFEGIPGSVGGAVFMNAGAYGFEIKDVLVGVDVLGPDGQVSYINAFELQLSNRNSIFRSKENKIIILKCYFIIDYSDDSVIYRNMSLYHAKRHKYQEYMYPTLGSLYSGSIYRSLAKKSNIYKLISSIYFLLFYKLKLFSRESPIDRRIFNNFTVNYFGLNSNIRSYSDKDLNTLVNRGQGTTVILKYIENLKLLVGNDLVIENEIIYKDCDNN